MNESSREICFGFTRSLSYCEYRELNMSRKGMVDDEQHASREVLFLASE